MSFTNSIFNFANSGPNMQDVLQAFMREVLMTLNCHAIATVKEFDSAERKIRATINYSKTFIKQNDDGTVSSVQRSYPTLVDVPVVVLCGGNTSLTFPIQAGDYCLILFNDRDIDMWLSSAQVGPLNTSRLHSFSDGIAIVGLLPFPKALLKSTTYDSNHAVLTGGAAAGTMAAVGVHKSNGKVLITNTFPANSITLKTHLQTLITDLNNLIQAFTVNAALFIPSTSPPGNPSAMNPAIVLQLTTVMTSLTALSTQIGLLLE